MTRRGPQQGSQVGRHTAVGSGGLRWTRGSRLHAVCPGLDAHGLGLEIDGSGGLGYESFRARCCDPVPSHGFRRSGSCLRCVDRRWSAFGRAPQALGCSRATPAVSHQMPLGSRRPTPGTTRFRIAALGSRESTPPQPLLERKDGTPRARGWHLPDRAIPKRVQYRRRLRSR